MDTLNASQRNRGVRFWPPSPMGRWAVGGLTVFAAGLGALFLAVALGQTGGEKFSDNWWLAGPGLVSAVAAAFTFVTSFAALLRSKDRSIAVIASLVTSTMAVVFMLGEVIVPH